MFTIIVNLFCVFALLLVKSMRRMDFYLVLLQSAFDFLTSGLISAAYSTLVAINYVEEFCDEWKVLKRLYDYEIPEKTGAHIEPK